MKITTIRVNISNPSINTRVGRLLFNTKERFFCFGLANHHTPFSMLAETVTTKGTFWNGDLEIVQSVEHEEKIESVDGIF